MATENLTQLVCANRLPNCAQNLNCLQCGEMKPHVASDNEVDNLIGGRVFGMNIKLFVLSRGFHAKTKLLNTGRTLAIYSFKSEFVFF